MKHQILEALSALDTENDDHWTNQGLPRIDLLVVSNPDLKNITRKNVTDAAPKFTRATPELPEKFVKEQTALKAAEKARANADNPDTTGQNNPNSEEELDTDQEEQEEEKEKEELDPATAELKLVEKELESVRSIKDVLEREKLNVEKVLKEANNKLNSLLLKIQRMTASTNTPNNAIKTYLNSQNKIRADKADRMDRLVKAGFDPNAVVKKSALDSSMSRKTRRGTNRPKYPVIKKPNV